MSVFVCLWVWTYNTVHYCVVFSILCNIIYNLYVSCVCHGECQTMLCSILECCIQHVCRSVCPYLKNHMSVFHEILCTCCLFACRHGLFFSYDIRICYAFLVLWMTLFSHFGTSGPEQAQWHPLHEKLEWLFVVNVHVACRCGSSPSDDIGICYVLPVLWVTLCFHVMWLMGQNKQRFVEFARGWQIAACHLLYNYRPIFLQSYSWHHN